VTPCPRCREPRIDLGLAWCERCAFGAAVEVANGQRRVLASSGDRALLDRLHGLDDGAGSDCVIAPGRPIEVRWPDTKPSSHFADLAPGLLAVVMARCGWSWLRAYQVGLARLEDRPHLAQAGDQKDVLYHVAFGDTIELRVRRILRRDDDDLIRERIRLAAIPEEDLPRAVGF
jgi:hypothetical protein